MVEAKIDRAAKATTNVARQTNDAAKKIATADEFITQSPLYVVTRVDGFSAPKQISFDCNEHCGKETTWFRAYEPTTLNRESMPDSGIKSVAYICLLCNKNALTIICKEMEHERRAVADAASGGLYAHTTPPRKNVLVGVMKLGQYPQPSVVLPKSLERNLGKEAAALYRKGLISRNNGYGLAAAAYMRRVVEDKTNELIEVAAQLAESHGVDAELVANLRTCANSKEYTPYEQKLKIAATVFPVSLRVGDINPLQTLYGLVSNGIHSMSEEECIEIADQTREVFDFIFSKLTAEIADRRAFAEKIKKLAAPNTKRTGE